MDRHSSLVSLDNDDKILGIAKKFLGDDQRLSLVATDGGDWISNNREQKFDYIFADTWHAKYLMLEEALQMLNKGALYIIDDMLPQPNWPDGHHEKVANLIKYLDTRTDLVLTKQVWASGIIVAVKR